MKCDGIADGEVTESFGADVSFRESQENGPVVFRVCAGGGFGGSFFSASGGDEIGAAAV